MTSDFRPAMQNRQSREPREPQTIEEAAVDLLKSAKATMALKSTESFVSNALNPPQEGGTSLAAESAQEANRSLMEVFKGLTDTLMNMNKMEREARIAAEKSSTDSQKEFFTLLANQAKDVSNRIQGMQPTGPMTIEERIKEMQSWRNLVTEEAKTVAGSVLSAMKPITSSSGLTSIDVELEKIKLESNRGLLLMQQNHEVAMRTLDIELRKLQIETLRWEKGEANKQSWLEGLLGGIGSAFKAGAGSGPAEASIQQPVHQAATRPQTATTPAGLTAVKCSNPDCGTPFVIVPGMDSVGCPKCGAVFKASDLEPLPLTGTQEEE
jgi:hypothetical protein